MNATELDRLEAVVDRLERVVQKLDQRAISIFPLIPSGHRIPERADDTEYCESEDSIPPYEFSYKSAQWQQSV